MQWNKWCGLIGFFFISNLVFHPTHVFAQGDEEGGSGEWWKGQPNPKEFSAAFLTGIGVIESSAGLALIGAGSRKIIPNGFVPEINNTVWLEIEVGPVFIAGSPEFAYSAHLRWDFQKDSEWIFYALGGLGGYITSKKMGNQAILHPRFGSGILFKMNSLVYLRGEISHEFIVLGTQFFF